MNTMPQSPRLTARRKNHSRWAWMAGATAAAAASPATHASTVQITLVNDIISNAGNHLSMMITSGHPFGTVAFAGIPPNGDTQVYALGKLGNSHKSFGFVAGQSGINTVNIVTGGGFGAEHSGTAKPQRLFALLPLKITDPNVAGGQADTNSLLEVEAFNNGPSEESVALLSVFYSTPGNTTPPLTIDDTTGAITGPYTNVGSADHGVFTSSVPEPSGLGLLALGAGGILARRQRREAA